MSGGAVASDSAVGTAAASVRDRAAARVEDCIDRGSGVEPPRLLHEVKPSYSEDARRRGIEGSVVLEIVVRDDGRVGDLRVIQRLGYGLDDRAMEAVRQWRFTPATRVGQPVDVIVEVAVEFLLR